MGEASRRARAGAASAISWIAALASTGCAGSDVDANPFYVGRVHEGAGEGDGGKDARVSAFGPLWDDAEMAGYRETALHPFWRRVVTPRQTRVQVLPPLYAVRWSNDEVSHRFLALSFARTYRSSSSDSNYDFMLFPLLWAGNGSSAGESYFALFPLFGQIKNFAAFAEAGFVLFPLYYWAKKDVTSPETFHSITPLIGWIDGGPRDGSWHLLPLAGHWKYEGKYDKWSLLWPILHWQRNRLDTAAPSTDFTVWPLFGIETSSRMHYLTFLWPFFRFRSDRATVVDLEGRPHEEVYFRHDFLWPLYRREHTRERDYLRLFPFYARLRSEEIDHDAFAGPLVWKREERHRDWTRASFDVVPLFHWAERRWKSAPDAPARADDTALRIWPLVSVRHDAGASELTIPALLPLDAEGYTADFLAAWGPLFELWHTRASPGGESRGNALFRLVDWESRGGRSRFSIPLLYSRDSSARRTSHSLLLGLLRFGGGEGGAELKLLGMPILTPEARGR